MLKKFKVLFVLSMFLVLTMGIISYADSSTVVRLDWNDTKKVETTYLDEGLYRLTIINEARRFRGSDLEYSIEQRECHGRDRDTIIEGTIARGDTTTFKLRISEKGKYEVGLESLQGRGGKGEFRVEKIDEGHRR